MLKPYNVKNVLNNIESVFKYKDIYKLNKTGYNFLYHLSGFIGHYDLFGFQAVYTDLRLLLNDIKGAMPIEKDTAIRDINDPKHNGYGLPYCQSQLNIVNGLEVIVNKYETAINKDFKKIEKAKIKTKIELLKIKLSLL